MFSINEVFIYCSITITSLLLDLLETIIYFFMVTVVTHVLLNTLVFCFKLLGLLHIYRLYVAAKIYLDSYLSCKNVILELT